MQYVKKKLCTIYKIWKGTCWQSSCDSMIPIYSAFCFCTISLNWASGIWYLLLPLCTFFNLLIQFSSSTFTLWSYDYFTVFYLVLLVSSDYHLNYQHCNFIRGRWWVAPTPHDLWLIPASFIRASVRPECPLSVSLSVCLSVSPPCLAPLSFVNLIYNIHWYTGLFVCVSLF